MKAFEAHALDYLLKPFSKERFNKAIEKMMNQLSKEQEKPTYNALLEDTNEKEELLTRLVVKHHQAVVVLPLTDIQYLEAYGDYIKIHTANQVYLTQINQ